jgi:hypothetical protein
LLLSPTVSDGPVAILGAVADDDAVKLGRERLRELVSLRDFLCCTFEGLGFGVAPELSALPLRTALISICDSVKSGTLFEWPSGSGNSFNSSKNSSPSSRMMSGGCVLRRMVCDTGRTETNSASAHGGKPWFSSSIDPGSSAGRSGVDGREIDRGRPGRGLCIEADSGRSIAHGAGERSKSLNTACRLDAALVRAKLYDADRGLRQNCLLSVVTILRSDGRPCPDFGVTCW